MTRWYIRLEEIPYTLACGVTSVAIMASTIGTIDQHQPHPPSLTYSTGRSTQQMSDVLVRYISQDQQHIDRELFLARHRANLRAMALTMWGEARDQGEEGMIAVGYTMLNRLEADPGRYGHSIAAIAHRHGQYDCWRPSDPNYPKLRISYLEGLPKGSKDGRAWAQAQRLAEGVLALRYDDPTRGSTHYHARYVHPYWSAAKAIVATIKNQLFYKGV